MIKRIIIDIFGNKASLAFAALVVIPAITGLIWKYNAWLDARDQAVITSIERDQFKEATMAYADALNEQQVFREADEKKAVRAKLMADGLRDARDQAILELRSVRDENPKSDCINTFLTVNERLVLYESIKVLANPDDAINDCTGTPARCLSARLREILSRKATENIDEREGDILQPDAPINRSEHRDNIM